MRLTTRCGGENLAAQERLDRSFPLVGIVNLMQKIARLYSKERTIYGFVLVRPPVFSPLTHPQISPRERRLVAIFNTLTMPPDSRLQGMGFMCDTVNYQGCAPT